MMTTKTTSHGSSFGCVPSGLTQAPPGVRKNEPTRPLVFVQCVPTPLSFTGQTDTRFPGLVVSSPAFLLRVLYFSVTRSRNHLSANPVIYIHLLKSTAKRRVKSSEA